MFIFWLINDKLVHIESLYSQNDNEKQYALTYSHGSKKYGNKLNEETKKKKEQQQQPQQQKHTPQQQSE